MPKKTPDERSFEKMRKAIGKLKFTMTPDEKAELKKIRRANQQSQHTRFILGEPRSKWPKK